MKHSATQIEKEIMSSEGAVSWQAKDVAGEQWITEIANMASTVMMPYFTCFNAEYPKIKLSVQVTNNSVHPENVRRTLPFGRPTDHWIP